MRRFTALVVVVTISLLLWVPARGERRSGDGGGSPIKLPNPKPYVFDACVGDFEKVKEPCMLLASDGKYYIWQSTYWDGSVRWTCKSPDGKGNEDTRYRYPCVYDHGSSYTRSRFVMYLGDIK